MTLTKAPVKEKPDNPASFRLSKDAIERLDILAVALNLTKTKILEHLIEEAYEEAERDYPEDVASAKKRLKKK